MKILFLANRIPYPPYRGDKLKIYNLAKRLCKKHELHLITFTQTEDDLGYRDELRAIFKEIHFIHLPKWRSVLNCFQAIWDPLPLQVLYFSSNELQTKLNELLQAHHYDAVHVQHLRMAPYLSGRKDIPRILDLPDAFSLYWKRRTAIERTVWQKFFELIEFRRLLKFEAVLKNYDLSLACSMEDLRYLQQHHQASNLRLLSNGVDLDTFSQKEHDYTQQQNLLFTGNMDYAPNIDAVLYFSQEIFPRILQKFPDSHFTIAGQRPDAKVRALANEKITVTGFVKDLSALYKEAAVLVAPLRFGAGTQNKVLEAMAMGVPVVCSHIGFEGLDIEEGEGAFMRTDPVAFAEEVSGLLSNEKLRKETGLKGQKVIAAKFDWDVIASQLEQYLDSIRLPTS